MVAELEHSENAEAMRAVTEGAVSTVNSEDVIAQVTAQACHQSGLSHVFQELLSFRGHESYFTDVPELVGHTYREALLAFPASSVIGRYSADGFVELNPPPDSIFGPQDQVIAASRTTTQPCSEPSVKSVSVLGWRIHETTEVVVNPPKDRHVHLAAMDQVLVVGLRPS